MTSKIEEVRVSLYNECLAVVQEKLKQAGLDYGDIVDYANMHELQISKNVSIHTFVNKVVMHVFYNQGGGRI
jgi:hypothetical protein